MPATDTCLAQDIITPATPCRPELQYEDVKGKKTTKTVIIFDWDDTLLASSFLSNKGYRIDNDLELTEEIEKGLKELEASVITVVSCALTYGEVYVITNAEKGWVEMSAKKFIPGAISVLEQVHVLSARSTYEEMFPESPLKWKFCAFQDRLAHILGDHKIERNIISLGDSNVEREAVMAVTRGHLGTRTKSVKFAELPSMEQLKRQIELVTSCFPYIHNHDGDLDLQLTVTVNHSSNTPCDNSSGLDESSMKTDP